MHSNLPSTCFPQREIYLHKKLFIISMREMRVFATLDQSSLGRLERILLSLWVALRLGEISAFPGQNMLRSDSERPKRSSSFRRPQGEFRPEEIRSTAVNRAVELCTFIRVGARDREENRMRDSKIALPERRVIVNRIRVYDLGVPAAIQ